MNEKNDWCPGCGTCDEARAEVERLRAELSEMRVQRARERARDGWAEVERLRAELDGYGTGDE